jgi:hypothetical protein
VVSAGERDWLLPQPQRLRRLGVDEVDLALILVVLPSAHDVKDRYNEQERGE